MKPDDKSIAEQAKDPVGRKDTESRGELEQLAEHKQIELEAARLKRKGFPLLPRTQS